MSSEPPGASVSYRAVRPADVVAELAATCLRNCSAGHACRVAIDGADAARPEHLASEVAAALRASGRQGAMLSLADWWRPASLRLEQGPREPDSYRDEWFDYAALRRETLDPLGPDGPGRWLPTLWDVATDRATRAPRESAAPGLVLLVAGPMLLGRGLPFELTVHLHLSEAALRRRTGDDEQWTVPALVQHERSADSDAVADVVVRADHPDRPALRFR